MLAEGQSLKIQAADGTVKIYGGRGILPLWKVFSTVPGQLRGAEVEDRVVGLGAAVLMVAGGVKKLITPVISAPARTHLEEQGVEIEAARTVDGIINRAGNGPCPLEALLSATPAEDYLKAIQEFAEKIQKSL